VEDVDVVTELVVTVKVALLAPAAMFTLVGTVAATVLLLDSVTTAPDDGAGALSVTVPWEVLPPTTLVGFSTIEDSVAPEVAIERTLISAIEV
jgi:hypothetical protein